MHPYSRFNFLTPHQARSDRYYAAWTRFILLSVLVGSSFGLCPRVVKAETLLEGLLLAQQVVDGLPPPPSLPLAQPIPPAPSTGLTERNTLPSFSSDSVSPTVPESQPARPTPQSAPLPIESGYAVYVNGDSPLLLSQVRQVESGAFLQTHGAEQVIQVGLFREEASAIQQVASLESQGIEAEVVEVSRPAIVSNSEVSGSEVSNSEVSSSELMAASNVAPMTLVAAPDRADSDRLAAVPSVEFGQQPPVLSQNSSGAANANSRHSYYVVVPGRTSDLPDISNLITLLGAGLNVSENEIQERSSPLGPHVLIGPFINRTAATRWNRYFRDFGVDARVYYKR